MRRILKSLQDKHARVAELADAQDLGSCPERGEGSSPSSRTNLLAPFLRGTGKRALTLEQCEMVGTAAWTAL